MINRRKKYIYFSDRTDHFILFLFQVSNFKRLGLFEWKVSDIYKRNIYIYSSNFLCDNTCHVHYIICRIFFSFFFTRVIAWGLWKTTAKWWDTYTQPYLINGIILLERSVCETISLGKVVRRVLIKWRFKNGIIVEIFHANTFQCTRGQQTSRWLRMRAI